MLPVKKPIREYRTLDEIRMRKDELLNELQQDTTKFTTLWNQVFLKMRRNLMRVNRLCSLVVSGKR